MKLCNIADPLVYEYNRGTKLIANDQMESEILSHRRYGRTIRRCR